MAPFFLPLALTLRQSKGSTLTVQAEFDVLSLYLPGQPFSRCSRNSLADSPAVLGGHPTITPWLPSNFSCLSGSAKPVAAERLPATSTVTTSFWVHVEHSRNALASCGAPPETPTQAPASEPECTVLAAKMRWTFLNVTFVVLVQGEPVSCLHSYSSVTSLDPVPTGSVAVPVHSLLPAFGVSLAFVPAISASSVGVFWPSLLLVPQSTLALTVKVQFAAAVEKYPSGQVRPASVTSRASGFSAVPVPAVE